jgi:hypothetical protein
MRHTGTAHGELDGGDSAVRFSGDHGEISLPGEPTWGFDTDDMAAISPGSGHVHDYMSYGGGAVWTSVGTWNHMYTALVENRTFGESRGPVVSGSGGEETAGAPGEGQAWIVEGTVSDEGAVSVSPPYYGDASAIFFPEGSDVVLTLTDSTGGERTVSTALFSGNTHHDPEFRSFAVAMPPDVDPVSVSIEVTGSDPVVIELSEDPTPLELTEIGNKSVAWNPGSATPPYRVEASNDGKSWWALGTVETPSLEIDPTLIPFVGDGWTIRVQGADGPVVLAAEGPIDFGIPAPVASIGAPIDGARVPVGTVTANAAVGVIGDDGATYRWSVDDRPVNEGQMAVLPILPGDNRVTLMVENQSGSDTHTINLVGVLDSDGDGLDDEWEALHGLDAQVADVVEEDVDEDGLDLAREYRAMTDPNDPDTDDDGFSDGLEMIGAGHPLDPMLVPGPVHGVDDGVAAAEPDVPIGNSGLPAWALAIVATVLVAPVAYWLGRQRLKTSDG